MLGSVRQVYWLPSFAQDWSISYPILSILPLFLQKPCPCTFLHYCAPLHRSLSNILDPQICILISCKVPVCLQFFESQFVSCLCLLSCQSSLRLRILFMASHFSWYPIWQDLWSDNLTEINIPSSISVTDQVCVSLLPPLPLVSHVCVSLYSCLWLLPFLVLPFCIEQVLDRIPLRAQTLSFTHPYKRYF